MIDKLQFHNFKLLRESSLPLGRCTILIGPNSSGKTTALNGLKALRYPKQFSWYDLRTVTEGPDALVRIRAHWGGELKGKVSCYSWLPGGGITPRKDEHGPNRTQIEEINSLVNNIRVYALDPEEIAAKTELTKDLELQEDGGGIAAVLDRLRDRYPQRWDAFMEEFVRWFPEYKYLLFDVDDGKRVFSLQQLNNGAEIPARALSHGTLIALALLTLAHLPSPPSIIGLEELDRGIHPRLLRDLQQAIYRLSYPEQFGDKRQPVQVVATTHSPYFLDLFKNHPEEIVICEKQDDNIEFRRLSEMPNVDEILEGTMSLGDVWYSGVLGGVPTAP